jgi:hypothetical protein
LVIVVALKALVTAAAATKQRDRQRGNREIHIALLLQHQTVLLKSSCSFQTTTVSGIGPLTRRIFSQFYMICADLCQEIPLRRADVLPEPEEK